jgi:HK97 family phage portal protein
VSPEESQFLATQKLGVAEIARIYGVPPEMIAAEAGNAMTYANVEQRGIDFLTYSIQPWLTRIESAISALLPGGKHVRFDPSVLLRTDLETQMKATAIGIASKQLMPDEARAMRDQPPLTTEQKAFLELVPLTVSPTGLPKSTTPTATNEGAPA